VIDLDIVNQKVVKVMSLFSYVETLSHFIIRIVLKF
jgi:hypothetical protein